MHLLWLGAPPPPPRARSLLPTFCMMANEITSASREGAITLLHRVITLYKWRSARPAICLPRATHTWPWPGQLLAPLPGSWLLSRHGLHGGQRGVGEVAPRPVQASGPNPSRSGTTPTMPLPAGLSPGDQAGNLQALKAGGGFLPMRRSRCIRGAGPSSCGRPLRPPACSAWRSFIRGCGNSEGRHHLSVMQELGQEARPPHRHVAPPACRPSLPSLKPQSSFPRLPCLSLSFPSVWFPPHLGSA